MPITDDDIARLKKGHGQVLTTPMLDALLARLEASELCASQFAASFPDHAISKAWRKAAGK